VSKTRLLSRSVENVPLTILERSYEQLGVPSVEDALRLLALAWKEEQRAWAGERARLEARCAELEARNEELERLYRKARGMLDRVEAPVIDMPPLKRPRSSSPDIILLDDDSSLPAPLRAAVHDTMATVDRGRRLTAADRHKLPGRDCAECAAFYAKLGAAMPGVAGAAQLKNQCSRHRAEFSTPPTPSGFWAFDFASDEKGKRDA